MNINPVKALESLHACDSGPDDALPWVRAHYPRAPRRAWEECERADWLLWLAWTLLGDDPRVRLAACACARTALQYVPAGEERPLRAIETAEAYARGEATEEERSVAESAAWSAARSAAARSVAESAALRDMAPLVRKHVPWEAIRDAWIAEEELSDEKATART
jgi:hypothetical protein